MGCNVIRKGNEVVSVLTDAGVESSYYSALAKSPLVNSTDTALELYKESLGKGVLDNYVPVYSKFADLTTTEPVLFYRSNGRLFTSLKQALNYNSPSSIEVGIIKSGLTYEVGNTTIDKELDFPTKPIMVRESNLGLEVSLFNSEDFIPIGSRSIEGESTPDGVVLSAIQDGLLSDNKVLINDKYQFVGSGITEAEVKGNMMGVVQSLQENPYAYNIEANGFRNLTYEVYDGSVADVGTSSMPLDEFSKKSYIGDSSVVDDVNYIGNLHKKAVADGFKYQPITDTSIEKKALPKSELMASIEGALMDLGVSKVSIDSYIEKYKNKFGEDITIKGISDIANNVYGFVDGSVDTLTEEASHFFIEAMSGTEVLSEAMDAVINTTEYKSVEAKYKDVYKSMYKTDALVSEALKKETLGKLLADRLQDGLDTSHPIIEFINKVIDYIKDKFRFTNESKAYKTINTLNNEVLAYIKSERMSELKSNLNSASPIDVLFSLEDITKDKKVIINKLMSLKTQLQNLPNNALEFSSISNEQIENNAWASAVGLLGIAEVEVKRLKNSVDASMRSGNIESVEVRNAYNQLESHTMPLINEISDYLDRGDTNAVLSFNDVKELKRTIKDVRANFGSLQGALSKINSPEYFKATILKQLQQDMNWSNSEVEMFSNQIYARQKDLNQILGRFGSMMHRNVPLLTIASKVISDINSKTAKDISKNVLSRMDKFVNSGNHNRITNLLVKDKDGNNTEMLLNPLKLGELEYAREQREKTIKTNILRIKDSKLSQVNSIDRLAKNIGVIAVQSSTLSDDLLINKISGGLIDMTEADVSKFKSSVTPTINRINELLGSKLTVDDIITKSTGENRYAINTDLNLDLRNALTDAVEAGVLTMSGVQEAEYQYEVSKDRVKYQEQYFKEEYYEKEQSWIDETRSTMGEASAKALVRGLMVRKELNSKMMQIRSRHLREDGKPDMVSLFNNPADALEYSSITRKLRAYENTLNEIGELDTELFTEVDGKVVAKPLTEELFDNLTDRQMISWGMIKLRDFWQTRQFSTDDKFLDEVHKLEQTSKADALNFIKYNGNIGFTSEYYDKIAGESSYIDLVEQHIASVTDPMVKEELEALVFEYKSSYRQVKELKRINRSIVHTSEFDFSGDDVARQQVLTLESRLIELRRLLPKVQTESRAPYESSMSNTYYEDLNRQGIVEGTQAELDFLEQNVPEASKDSYHALSLAIRNYGLNYRKYPVRFAALAETVINVTESLSSTNYELGMKIAFLKSNVASYYKRTTPAGFDEFMEQINSGAISPSALITKEGIPAKYKDLASNIEVKPRNGWITDIFNEDNVNPNYDPNGGYVQYKRTIENLDSNFFDKFGIAPDEYLKGNKDVRDLVPTRNIEDFNALIEYTDLRKLALQQKGMDKRVSPFRIPRKGRELVERISGLSKNPTEVVKNTFRDLISYRVDDLEQPRDTKTGKESEIGIRRAIPIFYENKLDSPKDQSYDLTGILMADLQQAYLFKHRKEAESTILSIINQIPNLEFENNIDPKNSLAMTILKEYIDANMYSQSVNANIDFRIGGKTIRVSKFLNNITTMFQNSNLMFNFPLDITGATTSAITRLLIKKSNEYFSEDSFKWASKEAKGQLANYLKESGNIVKASKFNRIMETIGLESPLERFENSIFNKGVRLTKKSPFGLSKVSNMTNTAPLVFTILKDHRLKDGKFINFPEFIRLEENKGKSKTELETLWKEYETSSMLDLVDFNYGLSLKEGVNVPLADGELDRVHVSLRSKLVSLLEQTEGVLASESRTWFQRHPILRALTTHKGWFSAALDRRFKSRQFNLYTNKEEVGYYRAFISEMIRAYKEVGSFNPITIMKKAYANYKELEVSDPNKAALKYIAYESLAISTMSLLALGVIGFIDDDDNKDVWMAQFAGLIYLRTLSELNSVTATGMPGMIKDMYEKPFTSSSYLTELVSFDDYSFDEVENGKYKGIPKIMRKISKLTPLKKYFDLRDPRRTVESYRKFNESTLLGLGQDGIGEWVIDNITEEPDNNDDE